MRTDSRTEIEIKGLRSTKLSYDDYENGYDKVDPATGIIKSTTIPHPPQNLLTHTVNGLIELHWDEQQNLTAPHKYEIQRSANGSNYITIAKIPRTVYADTPGFEKDANGNPKSTVWWYRVRTVVLTTNRKSGWSTPVQAKIKPVDRLDINSELAEILENGGEVGGKLLQFAKSKGVELTEAFSNWGDLSNGYTTIDEGGTGETTQSLSYIFKNFIIADVILGSLIKGSHIEAATISANHITISTVKDIDPDALNTDDYQALQTQIDNEITTYFFYHMPALDTIPAKDWSASEKSNNVGDVFYVIEETVTVVGKGDSTVTPTELIGGGDSTVVASDIIGGLSSKYFIPDLLGSSFRFVYTEAEGYYWTRTNSSQYEAALEAASQAQATADSKIVSFYQDTAPTGQAIGDIWYDTSDKNKPYWWDGSEWQGVRDDTIYDALTEAQLKTTTYTVEKPENPIEGDLFYNTTLSVYEVYRDGGWEFFDPMNWRTIDTTEIDGSRIKAGSIELSGMSPDMVETIELVGAGDSSYNPTAIIASGDSGITAEDLICGHDSQIGTSYWIQAIPPGEIYLHAGHMLDGSVELAKLGKTLIEGGFIKTQLINASRIFIGDLYGSGNLSTKDKVNDGDITEIDGGKIITNSITAAKIDVDDLIANSSIVVESKVNDNVTEISGGVIKTGKIQDIHGGSYFDLDTGYIKAVDGEFSGELKAATGKFSGEVNGAKFSFINTGILDKDVWVEIGSIGDNVNNLTMANLSLEVVSGNLVDVYSFGGVVGDYYYAGPTWVYHGWSAQPRCLTFNSRYISRISVDYVARKIHAMVHTECQLDCETTITITGDVRINGLVLWD